MTGQAPSLPDYQYAEEANARLDLQAPVVAWAVKWAYANNEIAAHICLLELRAAVKKMEEGKG